MPTRARWRATYRLRAIGTQLMSSATTGPFFSADS
jgi:hypothetical protein